MNRDQERSDGSSSIYTMRGNSTAGEFASPQTPTSGMNLVPCSRYRDGRNPCVTPRVIELGDGSERTSN